MKMKEKILLYLSYLKNFIKTIFITPLPSFSNSKNKSQRRRENFLFYLYLLLVYSSTYFVNFKLYYILSNILILILLLRYLFEVLIILAYRYRKDSINKENFIPKYIPDFLKNKIKNYLLDLEKISNYDYYYWLIEFRVRGALFIIIMISIINLIIIYYFCILI